MEYLYKQLRHGRYGGVDVLGFFEQPSGVLKGHTLKRFLGNFPDEQLARMAHPSATEYFTVGGSPNLNFLPGEDDPVPGGRYPDDIPD